MNLDDYLRGCSSESELCCERRDIKFGGFISSGKISENAHTKQCLDGLQWDFQIGIIIVSLRKSRQD